MIYGLKLLLPVLLLGAFAAFALRAAFSSLLTPSEYRRAWTTILVGTVVSFLSIRLGVFVACLAVVGLWAQSAMGGGARAKLSVFLLLVIATPPLYFEIGGIAGVNYLIDLTGARVLAIVLLPGLALKLASDSTYRRQSWVTVVDVAVVLYQVWRIALLVPSTNTTSLLRATVESLLDILLPYYVFSRGIRTSADLRFILSHVALALGFAATLGVVEEFAHRTFYNSLQWVYGLQWQLTFELARGSHLRVQAMTPQPILLAFEMIVALGIWAYLRGAEWRRPSAFFIFALLGACLTFTWSRGPWLGAMALFICMLGLRKMPRKVFGTLLVLFIAGGLLIKAIGADEVVMSLLGGLFGSGAADLDSIAYRKQLLDTALALLRQSPWLGVPNYAAQMQDLKQGEGIIDLVNSYVAIALNTGVIGLVIYMLPFVVTLRRMLGVPPAGDADASAEASNTDRFARAFISLTIAALLTIFTTSTFATIPLILTLLLALPVAALTLSANAEVRANVERMDPFGRRIVPLPR